MSSAQTKTEIIIQTLGSSSVLNLSLARRFATAEKGSNELISVLIRGPVGWWLHCKIAVDTPASSSRCNTFEKPAIPIVYGPTSRTNRHGTHVIGPRG